MLQEGAAVESLVGQRRMEPSSVRTMCLCFAVLCSGAGECSQGDGVGSRCSPQLWGEEEEGAV